MFQNYFNGIQTFSMPPQHEIAPEIFVQGPPRGLWMATNIVIGFLRKI